MSKYKLKSSRSIIKRFKVTSTGKLLRHKARRNHLLQKKTSTHKQNLRKAVKVCYMDLVRIKSKLL